MEGDTEYGECRCCLATGNHRDLMKEYHFNGIREVYYEIFCECYNLFLSKNPKLTVLICSNCIGRLRDAYSFRMMVVGTETRLLQITNTQPLFIDVPTEPLNDECNIKYESITVKMENEGASEDSDFMCIDDTIPEPPLVTVDIKRESPEHDEEMVKGEAELLARFTNVKRLPRRYHLYRMCPKYVCQLEALKNTRITSSMITLHVSKELKRSDIISEKKAYINNALNFLQYSNVTPFRSKNNRGGYPCFCCRVTYDNFEHLKKHSLEHKPGELFRTLKQFGTENFLVYVDISDLKCTICDENVPSLNELKIHLARVHDKHFVTEVDDRVIPFKIENELMCQICEGNFETFGSLERHMNGHFRNCVCDDCGTGFATKCRLKVHVKSMHADGNYPCEVCGKVFNTQQKYKNHANTVHKMLKRFKCSKCPERFAEYFRRQKHLVEAHGVEPLKYKCNVCEKSFDRRYTLSRHLKRDHLEERDFECDLCGYKCFSNNELKVHMVKHNGERIFQCTVCKKSYARKKTLKEHMRIHNNDRRFVCPVCGQAFVQKCSLKGHLKTHHLDYNLPV